MMTYTKLQQKVNGNGRMFEYKTNEGYFHYLNIGTSPLFNTFVRQQNDQTCEGY